MTRSDFGRWLWPAAAGTLVAGLLAGTMWLGRPGVPTGSPALPRPTASSASGASGDAVVGAPGIGDAYYPQSGNGGYDVEHYDVDLTWHPDAGSITGTSTLTAIATENLRGFHVDFTGTPSRVWVNDREAALTRVDDLNVRVDLSAVTLAAGQRFTARFEYSSVPATDCPQAIVTTTDELVIANEPEGTSCWLPGSEHPSDPATFAVTMHVPEGYTAVSAGRRVAHDATSARFEVTTPTPTYAVLVAFGRFDVREADNSVSAISGTIRSAERDAIAGRLAESRQIADGLAAFLGPYRADDAGGLVAGGRMWFAALETSGRPLYASNAAWQGVIVHELAHMWFGNKVTLARWRDIWLNEAMASYATWVYDERHGGRSAQATFDEMLRDTGESFWAPSMRDPGVEEMFGLVYQRGPMSLHALRNVMGDEKFFALWREWADRSGPATVEEFIAASEAKHGSSLQRFFDPWLGGTTDMPRTSELGFR